MKDKSVRYLVLRFFSYPFALCVSKIIKHQANHIKRIAAPEFRQKFAKIFCFRMNWKRYRIDVSLFVDLDNNKVLYVCEGEDASVISSFKENLEDHDGSSEI